MGETILHNDLTVTGKLKVLGGTDITNSGDLSIEGNKIILNDVDTPTNDSANGGGILLKGTADKSLLWVKSTGRWTSNVAIEASSFVKTGGTSSQFLMADGTTIETSSITVEIKSGKTIVVDSIVGNDTRGSYTPYNQEFPYKTIAAAVADSTDGDLIYVRTGDYSISTQINLDSNGNIYCEPGVSITCAANVTAFSSSSSGTNRYIAGNARFVCDGTGGVLSLSGATQTFYFEASSITNAAASAEGRVFSLSDGILHASCKRIDAKKSTMIYNSGTANSCYCNVSDAAVKQLLHNDSVSNSSYININAETVEIWGIEGLTIEGGNVSVKINDSMLAKTANTILVALKFGSDAVENIVSLRGGRYVSQNGTCIQYAASSATNKTIKLSNDVCLKTNATYSIDSAQAKNILVSTAHSNKAVADLVTLVGGTYIVDSNF